MKIVSLQGFRAIRIFGLICFGLFAINLIPRMISPTADTTFLYVSAIGTVIGIFAYLVSITVLEVSSDKKMRIHRPFWPWQKFEDQFDARYSVKLTQKQNSRGTYSVLIIESTEEFYLEKWYWYFTPKSKVLAEFMELQRAAFGVVRDKDYTDVNPEVWSPKSWEGILAMFGLPVELENEDSDVKPILTWSIAIVTIAVSLYALYGDQSLLENYGFSSSEPFRNGGVTFITNFFLHVGLYHLLGNMYFYLIFADNVEIHLGRLKYLLLLILSTLASTFFEMFYYAKTNTLAVGASGGIFGIVAFYLCRFPHHRFGMHLFGSFRKVSAYQIAIFFGVAQVIGAVFFNDGVSYVGHLGGMAVGIVWGLFGPQVRSS